jgi:nitrite reductase (NADH) small subunit
MSNSVRVASTSDLQPGECKVVEAEGHAIALYNVGGSFYATDNTCLHRGGPLGEGFLEGDTVTCPWHGWTYNVTTGVSVINPNVCLKTYPVTIQGSDIHVTV